MLTTALHDRHRALGAKMTEFHGWDMPLYYTSILEEHLAVRQALGVFDVSHMGQVLVTGPDALRSLNELIVSDLSQTGIGRACYTLLLREDGGILDDLIIYRLGEEDFLVIVNCGNRTSDVEWLTAHRQGQTTITDISQGRCILAVQGPFAARVLEHLLDAKVAGLGRFEIAPIRTMGPDACLARTGYTGGDGFELFLPDAHARRLWDAILASARPLNGQAVGLGARDTLRIEAGLRLYGTDMDTATTPWEAGLDWTVAINKPSFTGKDALVRQRQQGCARRFVGFELAEGPMLRQGSELTVNGRPVGTVTSGAYSPVLKKPLGMGYVEAACAAPGTTLTLTVRSQRYTATVVKLPFWKRPTLPATFAAPSASTLAARSTSSPPSTSRSRSRTAPAGPRPRTSTTSWPWRCASTTSSTACSSASASSSSISRSSSAGCGTRRRCASCWPTRSARTAPASGTSRPTRRWTRTASAATSARSRKRTRKSRAVWASSPRE